MIVECLQTLPLVQRQVWQEKQYPAALKAAQLQVDLSSLPAGDDTEIGAQLGWHMTWLEDLQPNALANPPLRRLICLPVLSCVCVCVCFCLLCDNTFYIFLRNRLTKHCDLLWLGAIPSWQDEGCRFGYVQAAKFGNQLGSNLRQPIGTYIFSCCFDGPDRHSPTSLNTEFHSYVCPRKGINISGGQKVRQLSKSVWPVGQLQTWKDWLLLVLMAKVLRQLIGEVKEIP